MREMMLAMPPDVFGAWGQWAGALGSFAAVVVALWVAVGDVRRRAAEQDDHRAAQARTIVSRVAVVEDRIGLGLQSWKRSVIIENHGLMPITDVVIHSISARSMDDKPLNDWSIRKRATSPVRQSDFRLARVIVPGEVCESPDVVFLELEVPDTSPDGPGGVRYERFDTETAEVDFSFLDAEGLRWRRIANGPPARVLVSDKAGRRRWFGLRRA